MVIMAIGKSDTDYRELYTRLSSVDNKDLEELVRKYSEFFQRGGIFLSQLHKGFSTNINLADDMFEGNLPIEKVRSFLAPMVSLADRFYHAEAEEITSEKLRIEFPEDKLKLIFNRLSETGLLSEIIYGLHTTGKRLLAPSIDTQIIFRKLEVPGDKLYPCLNLSFDIIEKGVGKSIILELNRMDLKMLLNNLLIAEKEIDSLYDKHVGGTKNE